MKPGRSPNWNVIADIEQTTWLEPVECASDGRLLLPASLRKRLSWAEPVSTMSLLAIIGVAGAVTVMPISEQKAELAVIRTVINSAERDERADLAYAAMATYSRISLQPDGRMRLSPILMLHLFPGADRRAWVGSYGNEITLWSESDWVTNLARTAAALREAVAATRTIA